MMFMTIATWEPEKTGDVAQRYAERGEPVVPEGVKLLGYWSDLMGGRVFTLIEAEILDPRALIEMIMPWGDLVKHEITPIMEVAEVMKVIQA